MLLFTLLVTGITSLLTGAIYYSSRADRVKAFSKRLRGRAAHDANLYAEMGNNSLGVIRKGDTIASSVGSSSARSVGIFSDDGKTLYLYNLPGTKPLNISRDLLQEA